MTVDGFFSGPNGELDWFVQSEELDRLAKNLIDSVDTILYGRVTYQMLAGYWLHASGSFADRTNRLPKLVFSSTLDETPWGEWDNAKPVTGVLADEVAELKNEPSGDMVISGSPSTHPSYASARVSCSTREDPCDEPAVSSAQRPGVSP